MLKRFECVLRRPLRGTSSTKTQSDYLTHFISITLDPTNGNVTIAEAKDVFTGYTDPNFQNWGTNVNVVGKTQKPKASKCTKWRRKEPPPSSSARSATLALLCLTQDRLWRFAGCTGTSYVKLAMAALFLFEVRASC